MSSIAELRRIARVGLVAFGASVASVALGGCGGGEAVPPPAVPVPADLPPALHAAYRRAATGGRDAVLGQLDLASAALAVHDFGVARRALDVAIADIESVFSNTENARNARSLWHSEGEKDFKGEPYERAMAFFYRGLLYAKEGSWDNARAAFRGGLLQDAVAEETIYRADFGSLLYLTGWASVCMGDAGLAADAWKDLGQLRPDIKPFKKGQTVLLVESGTSPRKLSDGVGHAELVFRRGKGAQPVTVALANKGGERPVAVLEDVYFQASTRGGRAIDKILNGKLQFKETTFDAGDAFSQIGQLYRHEGMALGAVGGPGAGAVGAAGGALSVAGAGFLLLSMSSNAEADTRFWSGLPNLVHITALDSDADLDGASFVVSYEDGSKETVAASSALVARSEGLSWYRLPYSFRPFVRKQ